MSVEFMVGRVEDGLADVGETQFGAVAGVMGGIATSIATVALLMILYDMTSQRRSMDWGRALSLTIRLVAISIFAFNWIQFNTVTSAISGSLEQFGGALVESVGGGSGAGGGTGFFAEEFDILIDEFSLYLNAVGENMGWMGGAVMGALGALLLAILGGATAIVLIFAKIMITFMIGIAPIMIVCSIFDATRDYFHRWLSKTVGYALYPLVIAGVFATAINLSKSMIGALGDPSDAENIGALLPFFMMVVIVIALVAAVPFIVGALSGVVQMVPPPSLATPAGLATAASRFGAGLMNTGSSQARAQRGTRGAAELGGVAMRQTAGGIGRGAAAAHHRMTAGEKLQRVMDRDERLSPSPGPDRGGAPRGSRRTDPPAGEPSPKR